MKKIFQKTGFAALALIVLSQSAHAQDRTRFFGYKRIAPVPGLSMMASCKMRLGSNIFGAKRGKDGSVLCKVSFDKVMDDSKHSNFKNSK